MKSCITLIKQFSQPVLKAEYCKERETYVIGYNQTINVFNGLSWTQEQAEEDLQQQIQVIKNVLVANFHGRVSSWQEVALVSLIHDITIETFLRSDFPKYLRSSNYILASNAFMQFNKKGRAVSITKAARRKQEQLIFNKQVIL